MQRLKNLKIILQYNIFAVILVIFCFFYVLFFTVCIKYESKYTGKETEITGKIKEFSLNGDKLKMVISAKEDVIATYYLTSKEEKDSILDNIGIGKTIVLEGSFSKPLNNTVPNNFNYRKYLYREKIFYLFTAESYEVKNDNNLLNKLKDYLIKRAYNLENSDYLLVLVLGDKSLISNAEYNLYQTNGTSHLLAISGSHISVLLVIFNFFLKKLKSISKLLILSLILLFFSFVTGFQVAVSRAVIFFILNTINKILKLNYSNLTILIITACVILILNPFAIYNLGFIYSFAVCGGIIYNQDKLKGNYLKTLLRVSFISFLFSMPISAYINYEINIMSILINMIFVPWISIIVFPLAIITYIMPILNPIFSFTLTITSFLNELLAKVQIFINIPKISLFIVIILFIFIILSKRHWQSYIIIFLIIAFIKVLPKLDNNFYIYYLDVGQGDSSLLITPRHKKVIMIDTGGVISYPKEDWAKGSKDYNLSDNPIKFLKSLGITQIDYMIITHGDYDHLKEAINIVDQMHIKNVILNNDNLNDLELTTIKKLEEKSIPYYQNVPSLNIGVTTLYFLNDEIYDNENDSSLVVYFNYLGNKALFMGDASVKVEEDILNKYNLNAITLLKVGHHGSNTSSNSSFINALNPKYSIISAGRNNRYNHPHNETLENLKKSIIYRTDISGTIKVTLKKNIKIETYEPYNN